MDRVTIIMVNFNSASFAKTAVRELFEYNTDVDLSIVIVDSHSKLDDFRLLKNDEFIRSNRKILLFRMHDNAGFAHSCNKGIRLAQEHFKPNYLINSNADISIKESGIIRRLLSVLKTKDRIVWSQPIVYNLFQKEKKRSQVQLRKVERFADTLVCNSPILKIIFLKRYHNYIFQYCQPFKSPTIGEVPSGTFFAIKNEVMLDVGCFDENNFLYHEEILLGYKLKKEGYSGILRPDCVVRHYQGASLKTNIRKRFDPVIFGYKTNSQIYYIKKYLCKNIAYHYLFSVIRVIELIIYSFFFGCSPAKFLKAIRIIINGTN